MPSLPNLEPAIDPLATPELPPPPTTSPATQPAPGVEPRRNAPGSILEDPLPKNPFPGRPEEASPRDQQDALSGPDTNQSELPQRRNAAANSISCTALRAALNSPLTELSLDVSPTYGEGLSSVGKNTESERRNFAASAKSRDWTDYRGYVIASGRLIDFATTV